MVVLCLLTLALIAFFIYADGLVPAARLVATMVCIALVGGHYMEPQSAFIAGVAAFVIGGLVMFFVDLILVDGHSLLDKSTKVRLLLGHLLGATALCVAMALGVGVTALYGALAAAVLLGLWVLAEIRAN